MRQPMQGSVARLLGAVTAAVLLLPATAQAQYLDPGAGSMIVQVVIALGVGLAATFRIYWRRISLFVTRRSKDDAAS